MTVPCEGFNNHTHLPHICNSTTVPTSKKQLCAIQSVSLHNTVTFQMLHCVVTFENIILCSNIVLLRYNI